MKPKKVTPEEVRRARTWAGLTQEAAAAVIGYTRRAWQDWESGARGMRRALLEMFYSRRR